MVYLHYRSLEELDFVEMFGAGDHTVVIPRITIRELDKHKNTHNSQKIKERAKRVLKSIELWASGTSVKPRVGAEVLHDFPAFQYSEFGLNQDWSDDVLIATILEYRKGLTDPAQVLLVTQDTGPRITALHFGLAIRELPDEFRLASELDPIEAENRELRRRITIMESARPDLILLRIKFSESRTIGSSL